MKTHIKIFWARLTNWEYWPWQFVYLPIFIYWLWCWLKSRAIFWFSAANPGFEYGGIIGASKKLILDKLPEAYRPQTILVRKDSGFEVVMDQLQKTGLSFPLVAKPDIGERGFHVEKIDDASALAMYLNSTDGDYLLQEYLDMPVELGVFYCRLPDEHKGKVTSVVKKQLLALTGDGKSTMRQLIHQDIRALQQERRLETAGKLEPDRILDKGETILLEPIGNHVRGTIFLDGSELINDQLNTVVDDLARQIDGFYYGRFDLRCASIHALYEGDFKVMELNGAASEPAHIYAPNYPIIKGYQELFRHWGLLYQISVLNHKKGVAYMSFRSGMQALRKSRFARA